MKFREGAIQIGQMPKGVSHREKIELPGVQRQLLAHTENRRDAECINGLPHHPDAWIQTGHEARPARDRDFFAGDQTGADGHIQHFHARRQSGPPQGLTAIPLACSQRKESLDIVVIGRGRVEYLPQKSRFDGSTRVIGFERWMRR